MRQYVDAQAALRRVRFVADAARERSQGVRVISNEMLLRLVRPKPVGIREMFIANSAMIFSIIFSIFGTNGISTHVSHLRTAHLIVFGPFYVEKAQTFVALTDQRTEIVDFFQLVGALSAQNVGEIIARPHLQKGESVRTCDWEERNESGTASGCSS